MKSPVVKRSIVITGHKTSVSLEDAFWRGLKEIAGGRDLTLSDLVATIDTDRQHGNLSSAIRLFVLDHYRSVSGRQVDDIDYYVVLAKWKLAVVLEQGFQRAGDDEKLLAFGPIVLDLMQGAADLASTTDYGG